MVTAMQLRKLQTVYSLANDGEVCWYVEGATSRIKLVRQIVSIERHTTKNSKKQSIF